jgi:hypothetical protein
MSLLSTVPRVIVIAMQVALAALVILATVPLVLGGIEVNVTEKAEISYEDHALRIGMSADVSANLYFDVTGLRYGAYISSGGMVVPLRKDKEITTHGTVVIEERVPLAILAMMTVCGASANCDTIISVDIRGSTLGGMISGSARADTVIADVIGRGDAIMNADATGYGSFNYFEMVFTVSVADDDNETIIDMMFGPGVTIAIGGFECTVSSVASATVADAYDITAVMTSSEHRMSPGLSLIGDLTKVSEETTGDIRVCYDGIERTLTKAELGCIIDILKILYGRHHP